MKKLITLAASLMLTSGAMAQWRTEKHAGDPLLGNDSYYSYVYTAPSGDYFVYWSHNYDFKVYVSSGIFHYDYNDDKIRAIIGYYYNGKLIDREFPKLYVPEGDRNTMNSRVMDGEAIADRIATHLENGGSVRIVADKYGGADFDITIPPRRKGNPAIAQGEIIPISYSFDNVKFGFSMENVLSVYGSALDAEKDYITYRDIKIFGVHVQQAKFRFKEDKLVGAELISQNEEDANNYFSSKLRDDYVVYKPSKDEQIKTDSSTVKVVYKGHPRNANREVEHSFKFAPRLYIGIESIDSINRTILTVNKP